MDNETRSNFRTWGDYQKEWTSQWKASNYRTNSLTRLTGWLKGVQTPPDGMVPADVLVRGISWGGWDWKKREIEWLEDPNKTLPMIERLLDSLEEHIHDASRPDPVTYPPKFGIRLNPFGYIPNGADETVVDAVLAGVDLRDSLLKERSAWEELLRAEADCRREFSSQEIADAKKRLDAEMRRTDTGAPLDTALKVVNQGPAPANEDGATSAENAGASRTRQRRTTRKPGRPKGPRPYKTQPDVVAALNGATLISPDGKKTSLHVSLRELQSWEADPANVPDELRGYCAAVRKTQPSWDAWLLSLGQKEGIHILMSKAAAKQSGLHPR